MRVEVKTGDVLDEEVDVLICTANPLLAMSGGVNGAILARGGEDVQKERRLDALVCHRRAISPSGWHALSGMCRQ